MQLKFSLSYILVIAAVLILLNSYPLLVSQNMMVTSNQNNLKSTAKVIESAMMGLEKLTVENVQAALEGLDESGAARIMVTNSAGLVLYDTRQGSNAVGEYALYSVVAVALRGQDASYCSYDGTAFLSRVATPVVYHNQIVGAVYAYDYGAAGDVPAQPAHYLAADRPAGGGAEHRAQPDADPADQRAFAGHPQGA